MAEDEILEPDEQEVVTEDASATADAAAEATKAEENQSSDSDKAQNDEPTTDGKLSFKDKKKLNAEVKALREKNEKCEAAVAELKDRYARLAAEFDNYKRRTAKELDTRYGDAKSDVWKNILPVIDNFERALSAESTGEQDTYRQGVELIYKQLTELMKAAGVEEIEAIGAEFDPELHNAVMHVDDESVGENVVVEVFAKGYRMADKILRHSMVKVAN